MKQNIKKNKIVYGFLTKKVTAVNELRSTASEFVHVKSGAHCVHVYNQDSNNLFAIAFRTPVYNHTGVPHIIEHAVLNGSQKFPVKEPFSELLKSSLQTFLNAFTYPDRTIYPVSSQIPADFFNLIDVYGDAVFFPLLTENTFHQEGWHLHQETAETPAEIKGVVFNEMQGAFADFSRHVEHSCAAALLPKTHYRFESGGDPAYIPNLSYSKFVRFHQKLYHPSNAYIFLYGNIPSEQTLAFLDKRFLSHFSKNRISLQLPLQSRWKSPKTRMIEAPGRLEDGGTATIFMGWMMGLARDSERHFLTKILSRYLLGTSASPLKRALIDSKLGEDLAVVSGYHDDYQQTLFAAGLRKSKPEYAKEIKNVIFETLKKEYRQGLDGEVLEGAWRQVDFQTREIADRYGLPFNIGTALDCYLSWLYGGDPLAHLQYEKTLLKLKKTQQQKNDLFKTMIKSFLIDNPHRVLVTVKASTKKTETMLARTKEITAERVRSLDEGQRTEIIKRTQDLMAYQQQPDPKERLDQFPHLKIKDLARQNREVSTTELNYKGVRIFLHPLFTRGVIYFDIGFDFTYLASADISYLPLFNQIFCRAGIPKFNFQEMAKKISLITGGFYHSAFVSQPLIPSQNRLAYVFYHSKMLTSRFPEFLDVFMNLMKTANFCEKNLDNEVFFELKNRLRNSLLPAGMAVAMRRAGSRISSTLRTVEQLNGIDQLHFLESQESQVNTEPFFKMLEQIQEGLFQNRNLVVNISAEKPERVVKDLERLIDQVPESKEESFKKQNGRPGDNADEGYILESSVNYIAKSWALSLEDSEDRAYLRIAANLLSSHYLWNKVRAEGGAYGARASYESHHGVFTLGSYRDPQLLKTLQVFDQGFDFIQNQINEDILEKAILSTIGAMDRPQSPGEEGFDETLALINGKTIEFRKNQREIILKANLADIKNVFKKVIQHNLAAITILGNEEILRLAKEQGLVLEIQKV